MAAERRPVQLRRSTPALPESDLRPVFLDHSGRRRRLVRLFGTLGGGLLFAALALLGLALSGATPVHLPGLPDGQHNGAPGSPAAVASPAVIPGGRPTRSSSGPGGAVPSLRATPTTTTTASAAPGPTKRGRNPTHTPSHPSKVH